MEALAPLIASFPTQERPVVRSRVNVQKPNEDDLDGDTALLEHLSPSTMSPPTVGISWCCRVIEFMGILNYISAGDV